MQTPDVVRPGGWPQVARATFVRDARMALSYRTGFLLTFVGSVLNILGVFFLSEAFGANLGASLDRYGGTYFAFAVVGVAFSTFMSVGMTGIGARIREGQMMGTLELMLLSPNRLGVLLFSSSLWSHAQSLVTLGLYLLAGFALGMDLGRANLPMAALSLALAVVAFNALGLISASVVIVIKQGNPVSLLLGMASVLLGGVLYPTSVLPAWLQAVGQLLPLTHALELMRRSVLGGEGMDTLWRSFLALAVLTAILLPVGLWACARAVRIAQTDGSLSQY
jgi:ABC-2 type transport system permease protein